MYFKVKDRREFIKQTLIGTAALSASSLLPGCTSFDEYLFDDRFNYRDEVIIVGGGISGLYLAHKLRDSRTEFRLFEGSTSFGGRIKSANGIDYGASVLSNKDVLAQQLVKDLGLPRVQIDKDNFYLAGGMQSLTDTLLERIIGLIPYRNFRLRWRLLEIQKTDAGFQMTFEGPAGQKKLVCKKLALCLPPSQWRFVKGLLELPEMKWAGDWLESLRVMNTIALALPVSSLPANARFTDLKYENIDIRQVIKKNRKVPIAEIDVKYLSSEDVSIDYLYGILKKKLQINHPFQKLNTDQYYDWSQSKLINGSGFENFVAVPPMENPNFQIIGDFASKSSTYTIEGALNSAQRAAGILI